MPFRIRCHLGDILKPGDIFLGFDLEKLTVEELEDLKNKPEAILLRKKRESKKRMYQLQRFEIEKLEKKNDKKKDFIEPAYEDFMQ